MSYAPGHSAPDAVADRGRGTDPYSTRPPDPLGIIGATSGNRWDSADGTYAARYFATMPEACFGETLAALRPSVAMQALVEDEWRDRGFMIVGSISADWRHRRLLVEADIGGTFLDIEAAETHVHLEHQCRLAAAVAAYGVAQIDVATVRGPDRRVTRTISQWVHDHTNCAGIRYLSRLDTTWECWAVFDRTPYTEQARQTITRTHPALEAITKRWPIVAH